MDEGYHLQQSTNSATVIFQSKLSITQSKIAVSCEEERMRMQYNEKTQFEFGRSISPSSERTQRKKK
jgi:hypothetical protein